MMQGIKNTSNNTFTQLMGNGLHYEVPKYQRDYSWNKEEWSDLWYDLMQMIDENDSHYMGYLVLQTADDKNYQIIDGQQRLTTICVLILAVVDYLKKLPGTEEEKKINDQRAGHIHSTYIGNIDMLTLTSVNKLVLNRNNDHFYKTYLSSLQEMPRRGLNASEKLLKSAFESFSAYLRASYKTAEELPLLMSAYSKLPEKNFSSLLSKIVILSFRYNIICGKNPNEQETVYNKIALDIKESGTYEIEELKSGIYVPDAEFEQTFAYKEFAYSSRNNQIAIYILGKLEKFESGASVDVESTTLEHILPDNPNESWDWDDMKIQQFRYRLGNMTLLEAGKNRNLGNAAFSEKKEVYKSSTVPMTLEIGNSDRDEWTEQNIEIRQKKMAGEAKGIWRF